MNLISLFLFSLLLINSWNVKASAPGHGELRQNVAPTITGQKAISTDEEEPIQISPGDLEVSDPDNTYPDGFTLAIAPGSNYSVDGTTIIPGENFTGSLSVSVTVNDGSSDSAPFSMTIEVIPLNDPPVIQGQDDMQTNEGQPLTIQLSQLSVFDPDNIYPDDFTLDVSDGENYSAEGSTIVPNDGFSGVLSVPVRVSDGNAVSQVFNISVTVTANATNSPPVITGQQPLSTPEEQSITIQLTDLVVSDPDNDFPADFTMDIKAGENYTVEGSTVTPNLNYNGTLNIPVSVNDGSANSNVFELHVETTPVNDVPVIQGQAGLSTAEDQAIQLGLEHLVVSDPDNNYPSDFSLTVYEGTNYTVSGTTVMPATDFTGTINVPVSVNDGLSSSAVFNIDITVGGSNDPPVITGQVPLTTAEETPITITLENLFVSDPDNTYPEGFSIFVAEGENYTVSGATVTPIANFTGTLSVQVTVNDGGASSAPFNLQISVSNVDDAPVITGQVPLAAEEDTPLTIALTDLTVSDADNVYPDGFTMTLFAGTDYSVNGNSVTPAANFSGNLTVPVTVNDGTNTSEPFNLTITINPVNDPPVITSQVPLSLKEDGTITLEVSNFTITDPDNTTGFVLSVMPGENYSVSGTTITPAPNFSGTLIAGVTVSDGTVSSAIFNAQIIIEGDNDVPVITGQVPLEINEEQPLTILTSHLTVTDTDNTYPQGFTIHLAQGVNYSFSGTTITPSVNYNGIITVRVQVSDGAAMSDPFDLQVKINPVNDAPVITGQNSLSTYREKPITIELTDLHVSDPDNNYPNGFSMTFQEGQYYSVIENIITPKNNFLGILNIPVVVNDGLSSSAVYSLKLEVIAPPNVVPVITSQVSLSTFENQSIELMLSHLVVSDPDNVFPNDFKLTIFPGANYSLNGNSVIPSRDFNGMLSVKVTVSDKESTSEPFFVQIQVVPVSDAPLITSQQFLKMNEESSLTLKFTDITVIDPDNSYPTGFTLRASPGQNYTIEGLTIRPVKDFNGYISVPVIVNDGTNNSNSYNLLILVEPLNDPPVITDAQPGEVIYQVGGESLRIFESFQLADVDDDSLMFAEIVIKLPAFEAETDSLGFESSDNLRAIHDTSTGTLVIFGNTSIEEYQGFIQNITYTFRGNTQPESPRTISVVINDGKAQSTPAEKTIIFEAANLTLDAPSGFTPNGDGSNDTWGIKPPGNSDFADAVIRIYNKSGVMVFESRGIEKEWDGRMNGTLLPADTYYYTIDLNSSNIRNRYKGIITILR